MLDADQRGSGVAHSLINLSLLLVRGGKVMVQIIFGLISTVMRKVRKSIITLNLIIDM